MHTKRKGNIGELAVGLAFAKAGYSIFYENGDISKIDLIAEKNGKMIRVQCKAYNPKHDSDCIPLKFSKSGPNYNFDYNKSDFDFFAILNLANEEIYLINSDIIENKKSITLRVAKSKNNQIKNCNDSNNYLFERVLRDYEQNASNSDDIVQTTTEMASEN